MLSNLASYLGYATPSAKSPLEKAPTDVRLRAVEEDEWVLVERNENEGGSSISKKEAADEDAEMTRVTLAVSTCPSSLPGSSKGLSRSASLDILSPLQESWYLTPPPSFTSEGPVHMETSPLENLLIEHPSMSVYEHSQNADAGRTMSNSSPSGSAASEEETRPALLSPIQERMYKLPRTKLNVTKKQSPASPASSAESEPEDKPRETKEPKMKSFVKSPRRSINSEMQNLSKKPSRKRPETSHGTEMISKTPATKEPIREEETPIVPTVQRRLYSEVLASKPKAVPVQTPPEDPSPAKKETEPDTESPETPAEPLPVITEARETAPAPAPTTTTESSTAAESESAMSVEEEESSEETTEGPENRDRRKAVQTLLDRQHRLHFLNMCAQKVEQRKTCDLMKKNNIVRSNMVRKFSFRSFGQRRADMMQHHSGANNNRKCAKTSMY